MPMDGHFCQRKITAACYEIFFRMLASSRIMLARGYLVCLLGTQHCRPV